jgi:hypothetical protein
LCLGVFVVLPVQLLDRDALALFEERGIGLGAEAGRFVEEDHVLLVAHPSDDRVGGQEMGESRSKNLKWPIADARCAAAVSPRRDSIMQPIMHDLPAASTTAAAFWPARMPPDLLSFRLT